jgi:tRNA dimethylallyltransferase
MSEPRPLLICIVGPTAIGKTSLSIAIANAFSTEILSADSRQFFKEMNIGTAVPTEAELHAAKHYFIQNKSIFDTYSVGDFEREAIELLTKLFQKHHIIVMVGGSGLYVDAVVNGLDDFPEVSPDIRAQLNKDLQISGIESLQHELKMADPQYFNEVDIENTQRVIRALEVIRSSGQPFSSFRKKVRAQREFDTLYIGLTAERNVIYNRINHRVDQMMEAGLLDEAIALLPHRNLNALQTVGYRELFDHLEGKTSLDTAVEEIKKNTRRFAKRQGTWFRKNNQIHWFSYETPYSEIIALIKKALPQ